MRFCIPVPCLFPDLPFCDALRRIRALGFDMAETYDYRTLDLDQVRNTCQEIGLSLISMCTTEFNMTDPQRRNTWLDGLKESVKAAKRASVGHLITQVGQDTGAERGYQHESILAALKEARPILEEYGITLMIEPLNTYVDHPGYYLWSSKEAFDLIREADHPLIKVVYDIYHQQIMEGNIIPTVTQNLDCIAHLHAAGHPGRHELQYGESDYRVIFSAIDKAGYGGACGLEYHPLLPNEESLLRFRDIYLKP